jgi:predicted nucleic acid-binding Zn ribbon protein
VRAFDPHPPITIITPLPPTIYHDLNNTAADFAFRRDREQRRHYARRPKAIKDVLAQLITARGYGRIQATTDFTVAWRKAAGDTLAPYTLPGRLKRGLLEVTVTNSIVIQELNFQKEQILATLREQCPDAKIRDVKFRIGTIN